MKFINVCMLMISCMGFSAAFAKHFVFEIDDVLFEVRETESLKGIPVLESLGGKAAAGYTAKYLKLLALDDTYSDEDFDKIRVLFRDMPVPGLWKAFFLDKINNKEALGQAIKIIEDQTSWYDISRTIYKHAAKSGFDPKYEVAYMYPVKEAHELVKELCKLGHTVYIFSNKNTNTMNNLIDKYKDLFEPFKGRIFISGKTKQLKPHVDSYKKILKEMEQNGVVKDDIVFIESLIEYKEAAEKKFGIASILWSTEQVEVIQQVLIG